jgi:transcriptional regulator with XRE-family HTH domain
MALRKSFGLHARELAQAMGVTRTRVTAIENQVEVSRAVVTRYRAGLRDATRTRRSIYDRSRALQIQRRETAGVSTLPAVSEVRRATGKPCS